MFVCLFCCFCATGCFFVNLSYWHFSLNLPFQYYRKARQIALHAVFPEFDLEEESGSAVGRLSYPRPISEPPSPTSSRATTPIPSDQSDEDDEIDEEREVQ